jgi:serine/threonine protein kinase
MARKIFGERWEVIEPIKEGGQAFVYKVRDSRTDQDTVYVLKRLKNLKRLDRFEGEIEACKRLNHPGIAPIIDFSLNDPAFFVTNYYEGKLISEAGTFTPLRALDFFIRLCDIVDYAHAQGVIHRDLKPDNVIITNSDDLVVLDFGLCYTQDAEQRMTETMEQVGSRFYMAPEFEGGRADDVTAKADTYALGKILYFMLIGRHIAREAFGGDNELSDILQNSQARYITDRILQESVVEDPSMRVDVRSLRERAVLVRRLISEHYYPGREGSLCRFCGEGHYSSMRRASIRVRYPSVEKDSHFDLLICDQCGNIQWFPREKE